MKKLKIGDLVFIGKLPISQKYLPQLKIGRVTNIYNNNLEIDNIAGYLNQYIYKLKVKFFNSLKIGDKFYEFNHDNLSWHTHTITHISNNNDYIYITSIINRGSYEIAIKKESYEGISNNLYFTPNIQIVKYILHSYKKFFIEELNIFKKLCN